jgi:hypothetical protein
MGLSTFLLRGVCQNRCLWGVEQKQEIKIRHSKYAPQRFITEAAPALLDYSNSSTVGIVDAVARAKAAKVAEDDESRLKFLDRFGFGKRQSAEIIRTTEEEEGRKPNSVWDFVQGITAVARREGHTDARIALEQTAGKLLAKATR